jgi:hypothetical protein
VIHIITPFSRPENIPTLVEHLRQFDVIWRPLHHAPVDFPKEDWIQPQQIDYPQDWFDAGAPCYWKMNQFISKRLEPDHYYGVLCDDDLYGNGFFDAFRFKIGEANFPDIIMVSMDVLLHGWRLHANPEYMIPSRVGFEQMFAKGKIWNMLRYDKSHQADGELIERVHRAIPDRFCYAPECVVLFNALQ